MKLKSKLNKFPHTFELYTWNPKIPIYEIKCKLIKN
jgi:hypothetical protein